MQDTISATQIAKLNDAITGALMEPVPDLSVRKLISYYGMNTACDRVYVFEIRDNGVTDNTYEWCEQGVEPQIRLLQNVPISEIAQDWMTHFKNRQAVVIRNIEDYRKVNPDNYAFLKKQRIQRLICVPMYMDERLLGFIGIDNPVEDEMDEVALTFRILANFTAALIRHRDNDSSLRYLNERDSLTGLNNLYAFRQRVKEELEKNIRISAPAESPVSGSPGSNTEERPSFIIYFNISNFRNFNALYGLDEGDKCLIRIAGLIQEIFETDIACRSFSDHFLVFYQGQDVLDRVQVLHDKCLQLRRHFRIWLRAGICRTRVANATYMDCDAAKTACDQLPDDNVSFCNVYSAEIMKNLQQEKYIQDNIANAVQNGQILVYFQPVVRSLTGRLCSFEALARWNDPTYGFLSPGVFIPVLEKHHQCYHVDRYVIGECCRMLAERLAKGLPCVPVSFNISRTDFMMCNMVKVVKEAAEQYGIDHRYLCVEITESAVMETPAEIKSAIREFKEAGFQVWMDDFGSAYSSLNTLKDFEFDEIKLDMAFMRSLNENSKIIVTSAVQMAKRLGIHTLCEGVETKEQLQFLRDIGCEKIQGYYYGKPMPIADQQENLSEKGIQYETAEMAAAMEQVGLLCQDIDTSYSLIEDRSGRARGIFASPAFRKMIGIEDPAMAESGFDFTEGQEGHAVERQVWKMVTQAEKNGRETRGIIPLRESTYFFTCRKAADTGESSIILVQASDITERQKDSRYAYYLRCAAEIFEEIYRFDDKTSKLEVVKSLLKGETTGEYVELKNSQLRQRVHPDDRERLNNFFDIRKRLRMENLLRKESFTSVYRFLSEQGEYHWKAVTFLDISGPDANVYLFCVKPSAVSDFNDAKHKALLLDGQEVPYGFDDAAGAGKEQESEPGGEETIQNLQREIFTDHLTGVYNRRFYDRVLKNRVVQAVAFIDIDNFSSINRICGHKAGDEVLIGVADAIRETVRNTDIVARYSGEEFVVVFEKIQEEALERRMQEVLKKIAAVSAKGPEEGSSGEETKTVSVSASIGACYGSGLVDSMMETASHNMHESQRRGPGQVTVTPNFV